MIFKFRNSIQGKINFLIISTILMLFVFMVGINLIVIRKYTARSSEIMMKKTCTAQALQLNSQLKLVEQSVRNIYDISERLRPTLDELKVRAKTDDFIQNFQHLAITIADNTDGAVAVYYRINPELNASGTQGFFFVKSPYTGTFQETHATDILKYDESDVQHVGWYYIPVQMGKPVWMNPYYNANINVLMISYVVPIYDNSRLIGVVGMDVDFERLISITENVNIYKSSGAVLCNFPDGEIYFNRCNAFGKNMPAEVLDVLQKSETSDSIVPYNNGRDLYGFHFETLDDGRKLLVYAKMKDINSQSAYSIVTSIIILICVAIFDLALAMRLSRRMTNSIRGIIKAARDYARGNWETTVECSSNDELKELSDSISIMASKTRDYISYINDMARKDALTGLRNKTDYLLYIEKINSEYIKENRPFSVVVFDVNDLKKTNDNLGHEHGDELIVAASKFICRTFAHSPIFRVGGDEFVCIIDSGDFDDKENLLASFKKQMECAKVSKYWKDVCIACGMASYNEDGLSFDEVFKVADRRMYENKMDLKRDPATL